MKNRNIKVTDAFNMNNSLDRFGTHDEKLSVGEFKARIT